MTRFLMRACFEFYPEPDGLIIWLFYLSILSLFTKPISAK